MDMEKLRLGGFVVKNMIGKGKKWIDDLVELRLSCNFGKKMMMSY